MSFYPTQVDGHVIAGVLAKRSTVKVSTSTVNPFDETSGITWERSAFFLNVGDDEQVLGVTHNRKVNQKVRSLVTGLVTHINARNHNGPFKVDAFSVGKEDEFWRSIQSYDGPVTALTFDLVIPNPPDTESETKKALKELKERLNAKNVREKISNPDGLSVDDEYVRDREAYATAGGGDLIAKHGSKTIYDSRKKVKTVEISGTYEPNGLEIPGLSDAVSDKLKR